MSYSLRTLCAMHNPVFVSMCFILGCQAHRVQTVFDAKLTRQKSQHVQNASTPGANRALALASVLLLGLNANTNAFAVGPGTRPISSQAATKPFGNRWVSAPVAAATADSYLTLQPSRLHGDVSMTAAHDAVPDSQSDVTWSSVATGPAPKVSGHATAVDANGRAWLFGGLTGSAGSPTVNDLWRYEGGAWLKMQSKNDGPGPRMYAAGSVLGNSMYLVGGWDPSAPGSGGTFKDEIWRLNLDTLEWSLIGPIPFGPVSRHTACTVGSRIIVHTFKGIFTIETDGSIVERPNTNEGPLGVSMMAAAPLGDDAMLLFGGSTKTQGMTADVWRLDANKWEWTKLIPTSNRPTPRASSAAAAYGKDGMVVFGGAGLGSGGYEGGYGLVPFPETWVFRVHGDSAIWVKVEMVDSIMPKGRVAASLSPLPDGHSFLLQGGWDPKSKDTYDEPWVLNL